MWQAEHPQRHGDGFTSGWDDYNMGNFKSNLCGYAAQVGPFGLDFIACFPAFVQVTQDWPLRNLPFTMPAAEAGRKDVVHSDMCMYAVKISVYVPEN